MEGIIGVTGASGHLGFVVCKILREAGRNVRAYCRTWQPLLADMGVGIFEGDILDPYALESFVRGCSAVIHCAAVISIEGDPTGIVFKTNTQGSALVLDACVRQSVGMLVHVSSTHAVLEEPTDQPFDENRPYKTQDYPVYDYSKAVAEASMLEAFRSGKIKGLVVRPSSLIGPYDYRPSNLGQALLDFQRGAIPVLTPGGYNFIDVRDAAAAIVSALTLGRNGEVYLLSGTYRTVAHLAETVARVEGFAVPRIVLPFWFLWLLIPLLRLAAWLFRTKPLFTSEMLNALKTGHTDMRNAKAVRDLGLVVRPFEETIRDFYAWNRQETVFVQTDAGEAWSK